MTQNQSMENKTSIPRFRKPNLIIRIKSMFIDSLVIIALMMLASQILNGLEVESSAVKVLTMVLIALYEPLLTTIKQTLGQKIMGIRVRNFNRFTGSEEKTNINFPMSLIRYIVKILLGWVSLMTIHSDNYGRAIHDKFGNSFMMYD